MNPALANIASRMSSSKGNHPVLWLIVGSVSLFSVVVSVVDGKSLVAVPRIWRVLQGMSPSRFQEVALASEPLLFGSWIVIAMAFSLFSLSVGIAGLLLRAQARKDAPRIRAILSR